MAEMRAIRNHIIFQFVDKKVKHQGVNQFEQETDWGFTFVRNDDSTKAPRWARVIATGHEVPDDIQVGQVVLLEPLKWTEGFDFDGKTYWRTDSDCVLGIDENTIAA